MLVVRLLKNGLIVQHLLHFGKQILLLVVVVRLDKLVPREAVPDERCLVFVEDVGRLLVDRVVAAEDRVVQKGHVRRTGREDVGL